MTGIRKWQLDIISSFSLLQHSRKPHIPINWLNGSLCFQSWKAETGKREDACKSVVVLVVVVVITGSVLLCIVYCVTVSASIPRLPKFNNSSVELKLINIIIQRIVKFKFNIRNTETSLSLQVIFC